ncbi:MAG: hypothetical protein R6U15_07590 [Candidatus Izemoplasmatales bacterium]
MKKLLVILIASVIVTTSCKKDDIIEPGNGLVVDPTVQVVDGHLNFQNTSTFKDLLTQMHEQEKSSLDQTFYDNIEKQGFRGLNKGLISRVKSELGETVQDTLVPDPFFAALLNDEREIAVNNVLYKITEFGTFITAPQRLDELNEVIDNFHSGAKSTKQMELIEEDMYEIENGIYLYDSQRIMQYQEDIYDDGGGSSGGSSGSTDPYGDIEWHNFDAHTWVGTAFQALFGRTRAYNRQFSSTRRIRVNFYSVDYKVYSGVGVNVTYQKKNWIGWSHTECSELTWGWEGIEYHYKLNYAYPSGTNKPVRKEYAYAPGIKDKKALTINFLDYEWDVPYEAGLKAAITWLYKKAENELAGDAVELRKAELAQFRKICPDKIEVVVAPYHDTQYNIKEFKKTFDWGLCEVSLTFGNGSGLWDIVGLANTATEFDVKKIRIYGIAKNGTTYKGIGIKKDN